MRYTMLLLLLALAVPGCVSFHTRMQEAGCRLVSQSGARSAYNYRTGAMFVLRGQSCYVCPNQVQYCN